MPTEDQFKVIFEDITYRYVKLLFIPATYSLAVDCTVRKFMSGKAHSVLTSNVAYRNDSLHRNLVICVLL